MKNSNEVVANIKALNVQPVKLNDEIEEFYYNNVIMSENSYLNKNKNLLRVSNISLNNYIVCDSATSHANLGSNVTYDVTPWTSKEYPDYSKIRYIDVLVKN